MNVWWKLQGQGDLLSIIHAGMTPQTVYTVVCNAHTTFCFLTAGNGREGKKQLNAVMPRLLQYVINTYSIQGLKVMQKEPEKVHKVLQNVTRPSIQHFSTPPPLAGWDHVNFYGWHPNHHVHLMFLSWHLRFVAWSFCCQKKRDMLFSKICAVRCWNREKVTVVGY